MGAWIPCQEISQPKCWQSHEMVKKSLQYSEKTFHVAAPDTAAEHIQNQLLKQK